MITYYVKKLSVEKKSIFFRHSSFFRNYFCLKVIGFNSQKYDIPAIISLIIQNTKGKKLKIIKRGNSYFDVRFRGLSFRDACNYLGPGSLSKFAKLYDLKEGKQLFPYEKFQSIDEIRNQIDWPYYNEFKSSLGVKKTFTNELSSMMEYFPNVQSLLKYFQCPIQLSDGELSDQSFPQLSTIKQLEFDAFFSVSPLEYYVHKNNYNKKITSGEYTTFCDYLRYEY